MPRMGRRGQRWEQKDKRARLLSTVHLLSNMVNLLPLPPPLGPRVIFPPPFPAPRPTGFPALTALLSLTSIALLVIQINPVNH